MTGITNRKNMQVLRTAAVLIALIVLAGCTVRQEPVSRTGFMLDTVVTITLYGGGNEAALEGALSLCEKFERTFSRTDPESEVYRLNHADGAAVAVTRELRDVVEKAVYYSKLSGGKYDVTICPAVDLWDFKSDTPAVPDSVTLKRVMGTVDYRNIVIDGGTIRLLNGAQIDLGSIAKGYIADRLGDYLRENGVKAAIVNLGGNILTVGEKPGGKAFRIGIQQPFAQHGEIAGTVELRDYSMVSSGVYERFFRLNGNLYHHILDSATGYPIENGLVSVTILSQDSVDGDALSTACFSLGEQEGMALVESLPRTEAGFIRGDGGKTFSSGFEKAFMYEDS